MMPAPDPNPYDDIFVGTGEMAMLMRQHDWSKTSMGQPETWPNALKVALRLLLTSRFEMWLGWGPDINFFYNDAYRPTLGTKHPASLGMPTKILWAEIWDDIKDRLNTVYSTGEATWDRALLLLLNRNGFPEETYHTFSYSPLIGETGQVEGVFCAVSEETDRVIGERRLGTLRQLAGALSSTDTRDGVMDVVSRELSKNTYDLPFSLIYLFDDDGSARLKCATGIPGGHQLAPERLEPGSAIWGIQGLWDGREQAVLDLGSADDIPSGAWKVMPPSEVKLANCPHNIRKRR